MFLPLLAMGLAVRSGYLPIAENFQWVGTTPALLMLAVAALLVVARVGVTLLAVTGLLAVALLLRFGVTLLAVAALLVVTGLGVTGLGALRAVAALLAVGLLAVAGARLCWRVSRQLRSLNRIVRSRLLAGNSVVRLRDADARGYLAIDQVGDFPLD